MKDSIPQSKAVRQKWMMAGAGLLLLMAAVAAGLSLRLSALTKANLTRALREHYDSEVQWDTLNLSFFPEVRAVGEGLVFQT